MRECRRTRVRFPAAPPVDRQARAAKSWPVLFLRDKGVVIASLAENPSRCLGAAKQVVLAPEFAELRQQRTTLANLLAKALNNSRASDADDRSCPMSRSQSARVAAAARWAR